MTSPSSMHGTGHSKPLHGDNPGGCDEEGCGRGSWWRTHVHLWLIHVNVWQKPPQYCKVISLQLIWKVKVKSLSHVQLFVTTWTVAYQATPSMGFSRQEYWSGLPFFSPGDLPNLGIKPESLALQTHPLPSEPPRKPFLSEGMWWLFAHYLSFLHRVSSMWTGASLGFLVYL